MEHTCLSCLHAQYMVLDYLMHPLGAGRLSES